MERVAAHALYNNGKSVDRNSSNFSKRWQHYSIRRWQHTRNTVHYGKGGSLSTPRYGPVVAGVAAADTGIFMGTNYGGAMGTELKPGPI